MTARQSWVCPDCGAVPVERQLVHGDACPHGSALDKMPAADREWFAAHPRAHRRRRPISPAEITELRLAGYLPDGWTAAGDIEVVQLAPGVRTRALRDVWIFPRVGAA